MFNMNQDEALVTFSGDYEKFIEALKNGTDSETLQSTFALSKADADGLVDALGKAGMIEGVHASSNPIQAQNFSSSNLKVSVMSFTDSLPGGDMQAIYASYCSSYCACNCCSTCDNCSCSVPPCST